MNGRARAGAGPLLCALAAVGIAAGCAGDGTGDTVGEVAENVLTLQTGTVSELRDQRGQGPRRSYPRAPREMLEILERAMAKARGRGEGPPFVEVYASPRYLEVLAKEFAVPHQGYADVFRSAVLAIVHPVPGEPGASAVEIHATHRGPFHRGSVDWERALPAWIDEAMAEADGGAAGP